jgi:hypothetical protein
MQSNAVPKTVGMLAVLALAAAPLLAHHSFSAEFSRDRPVVLEGEVAMMEWVNPHSWLHIDVPQEDGTIQRWKVEGGSPSVLLRRGWTRDSLPPGIQVRVRGFGAKDGSYRAQSSAIEFPDGTSLELGGTAGPENQ